MANPVIYDYVKKYSGVYKLEDIKRKILSKGYSEKDFNESVSALKSSMNVQPEKNQSFDSSYFSGSQKRPKWLIISGIFGIILLIIFIGVFVSIFYLNNIANYVRYNESVINMDSMNNKIIYIGVFWMFCIILSIFYLGFMKMGDYTQSNLIKYSSILFIVVTILVSTLLTGVLLTKEPYRKGLVVTDPSNPVPVVSLASPQFIKHYEVSGSILGALILVLYIFSTIFSSIGMILLRGKIKFSLINAILNFILIILLVVSVGILAFFQGISDNILYLENFSMLFIGYCMFFTFILILSLLF